MSLENAKANLEEFGKELKLELAFDNNNTCILGIDNLFSLHVTYEDTTRKLYLYCPVRDGLPQDDSILLKLCKALLSGAMLGGQMAGGGVGIAFEEELILMHATIQMGPGTDSFELKRFAPIFVEAVEKWRKKVQNIVDGIEDPPDERDRPGHHPRSLPQPKKKGDQPKPGDRFIKI